jgi:hypothetical protein
MRLDREQLVKKYEEGAAVLEAAVAGLDDVALDHKPADGGWSAREVVHHTADSELTSAVRLRRLIAEPEPEIQGYDEMEFSRKLRYDDRPIGPSLAAVRAARESTASILRSLDDGEWERHGSHSEIGNYSVDLWLRIYAAHCHDHAEQIQRAVDEFRAQTATSGV